MRVKTNRSGVDVLHAHRLAIFLFFLGCALAALSIRTLPVFATTSGPNNPTSATNDTGTGSAAWTNPGNVLSSDNSRATVSLSNGGTSNYTKATGFGFSIPSGSTINGITVGVERSEANTNGNNTCLDNAIRIVKSGTIGSTDKSNATTWPTTDTYVNYGGSSDLWGQTWTYSDVNASNFGFAISAKNNRSGGPPSASETCQVDHIRITVDYTTITANQNSYGLFGNQDASGQPTFIKGWGGSGDDYGESMVQTSDGGYAVTGTTTSFGAGSGDLYLAKYSAAGNLDWSKTWGGAGDDEGWSVKQTSDGGYIVTGFSVNSFGNINPRMALLKYDSSGNITWSKMWGYPGVDQGFSVIQTSDGGYAVTGTTTSFGAGNYDLFIAKFASNGALSWSKTWGGTDVDTGYSIIQTSDGGYAVTGYTISFGIGGGTEDMMIIKYDSSGNMSWSKTWGGAGYEEGHAIVQTSDGGYAITGRENSWGAGNYDMILVKFTSSGNFSWSRLWGDAAGDRAEAIVQTSDGGLVIANHASAIGMAGSYDIAMVKFNSSGTYQWGKSWGGTGEDDSYAIVQTSDGGLAIAGASASPGGAGGYDMVLLKYDASQNISGCSTSNCLSDGNQYTGTVSVDGTDYTSTVDADGTDYTSIKKTDGTDYTSVLTTDGTDYTSTRKTDGTDYTSTKTTIVPFAPSGIDVGSALATQNTQANISNGNAFRLRLDIYESTAPAGSLSYKLQYALKGSGTCTSPQFSYSDVTDSSTVRYFDNPNAVNTMALTTNANDPTDGGNTLVRQSYQESGTTNFTNPSALSSNDGMWDFALVTSGATAGSHYCMRVTKSDGSSLNAYNATPEIIIVAPPDTPTSPAQKTTSDVTISTGSWHNSGSVKFTASVSSANASDTIQLCVEAQPLGTGFSNSGSCGTGVSYSGSAVTATVTLSGLSTNTQYHWQAKAQNAYGSSGWASYGGNAESSADFGIDTSGPTGGTVYDGTTAGFENIFNSGSLSSVSGNWSGFTDPGSGIASYEYSIGTTPSGTDIKGWTGNSSSTSVTASGLTLQTSKTYYMNVRATDNVGNTGAAVYSSGQLVAPSLTFSVSPSNLQFNELDPSNTTPWTDTQQTTLSATTNAYNGFSIRAFAASLLTSGSHTIPGFTGGSYATPDSWQSGDTGFGYTSDDTSVGGSNKFQNNPCPGGSSLAAPGCYAPFSLSAPGDVLADFAGPVTGSNASASYTITNRITADPSQTASTYSAIIVYTIVANY
ncbi:MAG TPA: hypothetical protein VFW77_01340 [Candidatus Saccharimonadales bacterium]|nr:hypothetical protein [Candidatus Saccharimonadales bacterium]